MIDISKEKAQKILNKILEFEKSFERDVSRSETNAVKRVKSIIEEEINAIQIIEND